MRQSIAIKEHLLLHAQQYYHCGVDFVHSVSLSSTSQFPRIFNLNLIKKSNFIPPTAFKALLSWYLTRAQPSPLPHMLRPHPDFDQPVHITGTTRGAKVLDPYGNYTSYDAKAMKERYQTHNEVLRAVVNKTRQIGCAVQVKPNSVDLLNGQVDEDTVSQLFSKRPNSAVQQVAAEIDEMSSNIRFRRNRVSINNCFEEALDFCKRQAPPANIREKAIADAQVLSLSARNTFLFFLFLLL